MGLPDSAGDPRFFAHSGPHSLTAVAAAAGGRLAGAGEDEAGAGNGAPASSCMLSGVAPLQTATPDQVSYADHRRHAAALAATRAGAVIVPDELSRHLPPGSAAILTPTPRLGWAAVAALFHPLPPAVPGVHPSAVVDPTARVDPGAEIGPLAVIGAGAEIAAGCRIGPLAVIGAGVVLGRDCRVGAHVSVSHAVAGERVVLYPGVRIGQDGFGFEPGPNGFVSVPQLGRVILEDDVEVGANSTIDRGSVGDTVIGAGSRLDNLVQIGHNVRLGRCCVIVAQAGISGSTVFEDFVVAAGQVGVAGHLHIGKGAKLGAKAGVMADVPAGLDVVGSPAVPVREFFRQVATLRRLAAGRAGAKPEAVPGGKPAAGTDAG